MGMSNYYKNLRNSFGSELIFMPSIAGIVRNEAGEILFQNKGNGEKWSLPAGAIEMGEAPAEAVVREVWEETGLYVIPEKLLGIFGGKDFRCEYPNGHKVEYVVFVFDCKVTGGDLNPIDSETAELRYFSVEEMPELALPYPRSIFKESEKEKTEFQWENEWVRNLQNKNKIEIVQFLKTDEMIELAERSFDQHRRRILELLAEADIQHVGSTAIPGSLTKGDLDIQVRVKAEEFQAAIEALSTLYHVNEGSTQTDTFTAFKDDNSVPPLGVQLTVYNSDLDIFWKIREVLLANEKFRIEYDQLKEHYSGREMAKYRDAKNEFFQRLLGSAEFNSL
jgi:8-oxo-dGTP pyrophosphatase MutT (NUDIX family)/GrpB-like predicted nucleotidyltransferase (UPF0157 family)